MRARNQAAIDHFTVPVVRKSKATLFQVDTRFIREDLFALPAGHVGVAFGAEWRQAGCSMCLGMNPDQLAPQERSASTSNRNFEGRQGFKGRTHLVSPAMAAAAALAVELCGWRLDLAEAIVRAGRDDLMDPVGWLERRGAHPLGDARQFGGNAMRCPMALLLARDRTELERRIWRAQLIAVFPWIEEARQA